MDDVRFEQVNYGPQFWAFVPALALVLLIVLCLRNKTAFRDERGLRISILLWLAPNFVLLAASTVWYLAGCGSPDIFAPVAFSIVCVLSGWLTMCRNERSLPSPALLAAIVAAGVFALELAGNGKWTTIGPQFWAVETVLVGLFLVGLWFATGRRGIGPAIGLFALTFIGVAQHYVVEFRGTSILPSDVLALSTAMSVSGGYTYDLSTGMLLSFAVLSLGLACCSWLRTDRAAQSLPKNAAFAAACWGLIALLVLVPSYGNVFGAYINYWWSKDWYERQGFLPSFVYACQDLAVTAPEGYTDEDAHKTQEALARRHREDAETVRRRKAATKQFDAKRPNIIVIQNETFCDLSSFDGLKNGYEGPGFWNNGLDDALARGSLAVSVYGGGTCNTEFELLTGSSLAFLGSSKYPFTMYDLSSCASLPRQLAAEGYRSVGIHPNLASNWNRDRAYNQLGFDEFLVDVDFEGAEQYHTHVSDWATYERTLDMLRKEEQPLFVFDVTMQNHSGYDTGSIPPDQLRNYEIEDLGEEETFHLNEYLACIDESDRALERLVAALKDSDEPTIVVMYGDHHPWFSETVNDLIFPDEEELVHAERAHNTDYIMWANYKIDGGVDNAADGGDASADLLAAMMLDIIGAPETEFQEAQLGLRSQVRAVNASGYLDPDGNWRPLEEAPRELSFIEYLSFGSIL